MRRVILKEGEQFKSSQINRTGAFNAGAIAAATSIIEEVRERGDAALRDFTAKFDGVEVKTSAYRRRRSMPPQPNATQRRSPHSSMRPSKFASSTSVRSSRKWIATRENGAIVGAKVTPLESVGIYVPGGRALYPSTVLMNAIPASVAGVERIACVTPPSMTARSIPPSSPPARSPGVTEIYSVGGARLSALLPTSTETIRPVCQDRGPGNAYVAAAKKIVSGDVGIDMIAGPSEVCVVADETADPALVAIDLMAPAEHDPLTACYLVTFSEEYADQIEAAIEAPREASTRAEMPWRRSTTDLIAIYPDRRAAIRR